MYCRPLPILAVLLLAACSTGRDAAPQKIAVLRLENLTGDASLNWMGRAASEVLIEEIGGIPSATLYRAAQPFGRHPIGSPGISTEFTDALLAGATRIVSGYYEQVDGKLLFTTVEEDVRTGKTVRESQARGSVLTACAALAKQFTASPKPYSTQNEAALSEFTRANEGAGDAGTLYAQAVAADPHFSDAYLAWSETAAARGDGAAVGHIVKEARENGLSAAVTAKLEMSQAALEKDPAALDKALRRIVETDPGDISAIQALGDSAMTSHNFSKAADYYAKGASANNPTLYNLQAYARMFGGDEKGALAAVRKYQEVRPQDANAIDSQGDIEFFFGHFAEAEKSYMRSAAKDPAFNQGSEVWKAARARLMTGDTAGAGQLFARYREEREKAKDASVPFRSAEWRFVSGDRNGGMEAMHKLADETSNAALKPLALAQLAIWELDLGRKQDAVRDADAVLKAGQSQSVLAAALVRFASGAQSQSPAEMRDIAVRTFNGPALAQMRSDAPGYALFFAKRYAEAVPIWKEIYEASSPNDQTPAFLYTGALRESGRDAGELLKRNPLPQANLAPSFECLYFPRLFEWRGDRVTFLKLSGNTGAPAK